jgi:hypothetical protein
MQQIKMFKGLENDLAGLEAQVNEWMRESNIRVVSVVGNIAPQSESSGGGGAGVGTSRFAPSDVILIVLYEVPVA